MIIDLEKLNSLTKYPSILTYHAMGDKGKLKTELAENKKFPESEQLFVYEKVDGENSRIIFLNTPDGVDYFIGSREELLTSKGDRIYNPAGDIAKLLIPVAEKLKNTVFNGRSDDAMIVIYQESYGGKTRKTKEYTSSNAQSYRMFDVFSLDYDQYDSIMRDKEVREIASWRDGGNQPFYNESDKVRFALYNNISMAPLLSRIDTEYFPQTVADTYEYLKDFSVTEVGIDAIGKSEGIMVRTESRSMIRKIRFEDYQRTLGIKNKK